MSKIDEQMKWYREGRLKALEVVKDAVASGEDPIKKLEEDIGYIDRMKVPPTLSKKQYQEEFKKIQVFTIDSMLMTSMATLYQNENWEADKLSEFADTMNTYANAIVEGSIDWDGIEEMLKGIGVNIEFS